MKTKVWTLSIRLFHWLLAIGFTSAYILGDFDEYAHWHFAFGLLVGTLILFRVVFGLIGNKYARFNDFPIGITHQLNFIKAYFKPNRTYVGHNPAAAIVMIAIFVVGLCCSVSGYLLYSAEDVTFLGIGISEHFIEETHEFLANTFLILVVIHLVGLFFDRLFHSSTKTLNSIFTGYKEVDGENSQQTKYQTGFSIVWFVMALLAFIYGFNL